MKIQLIQRRTIWWPTAVGWVILIVVLSAPIFLWWFEGEAFLASTRRETADLLVVEGWIGIDGIQASKQEFERGGYRYVVTAGGTDYSKWDRQRWNYAEFAHDILVQAGVPPDKILTAQGGSAEDHRTFRSAVAVCETLETNNIQAKAVNVFTVGVHARRSRVVFSKAFSPSTQVGVISWTPPHFRDEPWWKSSERAVDLIKETVGYTFEILLNSGRTSNGPTQSEPARK